MEGSEESSKRGLLRPRAQGHSVGITGHGPLQGVLVAGKVMISRDHVPRVDVDVFGRLLSNSCVSEETDIALMDEEVIALMLDDALAVADSTGASLSCEELFSRFASRNPRFHLNFLVFHHFWRQGWVIKAGSNFGVEFALYRGSPMEFHSEHCVLVVDSENDKVTWLQLDALTRLMPDFNKLLLLCYVKRTKPGQQTNTAFLPQVLSDFEVHPIAANVRRGGTKQQVQDMQSVLQHVKSRALKKRGPTVQIQAEATVTLEREVASVTAPLTFQSANGSNSGAVDEEVLKRRRVSELTTSTSIAAVAAEAAEAAELESNRHAPDNDL